MSYVARLGQVGMRMEEATAEALRLAEKRMLPPRFIVRVTVAQMQQFVSTPAAQNPFVTAFADRMAAAGSIPEAKRGELRSAAERVTVAQVYPAWRNAIAVLESLAGRTTDDAGLWRFKGGAEAYAYHLRRFTTTNLSANEIHEIGLREVARIEKEMDTILRRLGRTNGSVSERIGQFETDLAYPAAEEGRTLIMADVEQTMRDAEHRAGAQFDRAPRAPVTPGRFRASARRPPPPATPRRAAMDRGLGRSRFRCARNT